MAKRHLVVVGAGSVGRSLLGFVPSEWTAAVIDIDKGVLEALPSEVGAGALRRVAGDATSRLVLERAGVDRYTLLAIVTGNDRVNCEVARVARESLHVDEIACLLDDLQHCEEAGIQRAEIVERAAATSMLVFNKLAPGSQLGAGLGLGLGEIRQITVLEGSAAVGKALKELNPRKWLVAAVYRHGGLVIPHGDTVVHARDDLLIVGERDELESVAAFLRGGEPVFPTQYGRVIGLTGGNGAVSEAQWLRDVTRADEIIPIADAMLALPSVSVAEASRALAREEVGLLVMPHRPIPLLARFGVAKSPRRELIIGVGVPVLVARGSQPYRRILLALSGSHRLDQLTLVAVDLARQCDAAICVLTVLTGSLARSEEDTAALRDVPNRVRHIARLYGVELDSIEEKGNPIEVIRRLGKDFDLVVMGTPSRPRHGPFSPEVTAHVLHDAPCSVLFVPPGFGR